MSVDITNTKRANIGKISKKILAEFPRIRETKIATPFFVCRPLENWLVQQIVNEAGKTQDIVVGIDWWEAHNFVKHDREKNFSDANLSNCIYSLASLVVMELYLSQIVLGNVDMISSLSCDYFGFFYGLVPLASKRADILPDFQ